MLLATFLAAASAQAAINVTIQKPAYNGLVGDNAFIGATVDSTFELQTVQASVEGRQVQMQPGWITPMQLGWTGTVSLAGLSRGAKVLTVTATDVFSSSGQATGPIVHDALPVLDLTGAPPNGTCARPNVSAAFSASDDDPSGPTQVQLLVNGTMVASGVDSLSTNLSLSAYEGRTVNLSFRAADSAQQSVTNTRQVYVQSSTNLVQIDQVSEGMIQDVKPDRILFRTMDGFPKLKVRLRSSGAETLVFTHLFPGEGLGRPQLSARGVLFDDAARYSHGYTTAYSLYLWEGGAPLELGYQDDYIRYLVNKGDYAIWGWGNSGNHYARLSLTDLRTRVSTIVANETGYSSISSDLADNGDVFFAPKFPYSAGNQGLYRYRDGTTTLLASDPNNSIDLVKTDGTSVYYLKNIGTNSALMRYDAGGESVVLEGWGLGRWLEDYGYFVNNGWVAYSVQTGSSALQIWRRAPDGTQTRLTFWSTTSVLAGLAPNGEVAFHNGGHLYVSNGSWPPLDVAQDPARDDWILGPLPVLWENGSWYTYLGRSLFQISTGSPRIASPRVLPTGDFAFDLIGAGGQIAVVQTSTDLKSWSDWRTNTVAAGATLQVTDSPAPGIPAKYYRVRLQ